MSRWRLVIFGFLVLLIAIPLLLPFVDLLAHPDAWRLWSEGPRLWGLAKNTLFLVVGTLVLALPVGIGGAVLLYRTDLPLRGVLRFLALVTLFVPLPLFASGWQAALGSGGWLPLTFWTNPLPGDPDVAPGGLVWKAWGQGWVAAVWIHAAAALPWVILLVGTGLQWVERALEEDGLTCASPGRVLFRVTLPRARAAIAAAALWVALQAATEIAVTDMFQVRTFAEEIYTQTVVPDPDGDPVARAVAVSLPSVLLTWFVVLGAAVSWERRLPPPGHRAREPYVFRLGRGRVPGMLLSFLIVLILAGVPVASLVWRLGVRGSAGWSATVAMHHLGKVVQTRGGLVVESLTGAAAAGAVAALLALVACWLAVGARRFRVALLLLAALAWALPGPALGLGLKSAISHLLDLTNNGVLGRLLYYGPSPLPVLWAYLVRFFPYAIAILWPIVRLLPRDLTDAARVDGAAPMQEFRHVVWPTSAAAAARAGLAVAVLALGELSAGKLLETPGSVTFAHEVFAQMHYGVTNDLAALCLLLLAAVLLTAAPVGLLGRGKGAKGY